MIKSGVRGGEISWRELLYSFEFPKYFIFGEKSLPDDDFEKLKEHNIKIEVVPNTGHSMAWENPHGLAQAIKKPCNFITARLLIICKTNNLLK